MLTTRLRVPLLFDFPKFMFYDTIRIHTPTINHLSHLKVGLDSPIMDDIDRTPNTKNHMIYTKRKARWSTTAYQTLDTAFVVFKRPPP